MSAHTADTIAVFDGIGSVDSSLFFNKICCHLLHQFLFHHLLCRPLHCLVFLQFLFGFHSQVHLGARFGFWPQLHLSGCDMESGGHLTSWENQLIFAFKHVVVHCFVVVGWSVRKCDTIYPFSRMSNLLPTCQFLGLGVDTVS
jgi:hypothetical protein